MACQFRVRQRDHEARIAFGEQRAKGCVEPARQARIHFRQKTGRPFASPIPMPPAPQDEFDQLGMEQGSDRHDFVCTPITQKVVDRVRDLVTQSIQCRCRKRWRTASQTRGYSRAQSFRRIRMGTDDRSLDDHVQNAWAAPCYVLIDEPGQRLWIVDECLDRHPIDKEGFPPCRVKAIEDDNQVDIRQIRTFTAHDGPGDIGKGRATVPGMEYGICGRQRLVRRRTGSIDHRPDATGLAPPCAMMADPCPCGFRHMPVTF